MVAEPQWVASRRVRVADRKVVVPGRGADGTLVAPECVLEEEPLPGLHRQPLHKPAPRPEIQQERPVGGVGLVERQRHVPQRRLRLPVAPPAEPGPRDAGVLLGQPALKYVRQPPVQVCLVEHFDVLPGEALHQLLQHQVALPQIQVVDRVAEGAVPEVQQHPV